MDEWDTCRRAGRRARAMMNRLPARKRSGDANRVDKMNKVIWAIVAGRRRWMGRICLARMWRSTRRRSGRGSF